MATDNGTYPQQQEDLASSKTPLHADQHILRSEIFQVQDGLGGHETNNSEKKSAPDDGCAPAAALQREENMSENFRNYTRRNKHCQELHGQYA